MASEEHDTVYPGESHDLDDDEEESESDDDLEDNDDVLAPEENDDEEDEAEEEEDLNSVSTSSPPPVPTTTTTAKTAATMESATKTAITATPTSATLALTVAVPAAVPVTTVPNGIDPPLTTPIDDLNRDPKRQRIPDALVIVQEDKQKPPPQLDDSRRLFQRLWTDEDEIELLQGFLDYTTSHRLTGNSHHTDTAMFYDQIKSKLQLDFNKNQLVEKLRRLKKKYRNVMSKISAGKDFSFKSPHDQATFEISRKIWSNTGKIIGVEDNVLDDEETNNNVNNNHISNVSLSNPHFEVKVEDGVERKGASSRSRKRSRSRSAGKIEDKRGFSDGFVVNNENLGGGVGNIGVGVIEDSLRSCLSPVFKEMLSGAMMMMGGMPCGGMGMGAWNPMIPMSFGGIMGFGSGGGSGSGGEFVDERWRKQQILELEVYLKRLELVQDQIKATLEELRTTGGG